MRAKLFAIIWGPAVAVLLTGIFLLRAYESGEKKRNAGETCQVTSLPKIDREAAMEFLEAGECLGGEIEEKQFTVFICKGEK